MTITKLIACTLEGKSVRVQAKLRGKRRTARIDVDPAEARRLLKRLKK